MLGSPRSPFLCISSILYLWRVHFCLTVATFPSHIHLFSSGNLSSYMKETAAIEPKLDPTYAFQKLTSQTHMYFQHFAWFC